MSWLSLPPSGSTAAGCLPDFLVPDAIADESAMNSTGNFYYSPQATPVLRKQYAEC